MKKNRKTSCANLNETVFLYNATKAHERDTYIRQAILGSLRELDF